MNIIFLTLVKLDSIQDRGIYHDLMQKFRDEGHHVTIVCPNERKYKKPTHIFEKDGVRFLQVRILNIQKTNLIEKGISTISIDQLFLRSIKKYTADIKFDLILYSTPPITFTNTISYLKKRDQAKTYLLLKDIFPQNAVDLKMFSKKGLIYKYFRRREKKLYRISDKIGCMSEANVQFLKKHNPEIPVSKVHVNPNSIIPIEKKQISEEEKNVIKSRYNIPLDAKVFIYGGNLGKPQGLDFLLKTLEHIADKNVFFIIVGSGTEFKMINDWFSANRPNNAILLESLPKKDFDELMLIGDVGLIFLHKDFTIPNFPSRLLSYLENSMPVICATDKFTDIGEIVENNNCGFKVLSGDTEDMLQKIDYFCTKDFQEMRNNARNLLEKDYTIQKSYQAIIQNINNKNVPSVS